MGEGPKAGLLCNTQVMWCRIDGGVEYNAKKNHKKRCFVAVALCRGGFVLCGVVLSAVVSSGVLT